MREVTRTAASITQWAQGYVLTVVRGEEAGAGGGFAIAVPGVWVQNSGSSRYPARARQLVWRR